MESVVMRSIPGWDHYLAASNGAIYSAKKPGQLRRLRPGLTSKGYQQVQLCKGGVCRSQLVHLLILDAFRGPRPAGMTGSHLDGNNQNNRPSNLAWETHADNVARKVAHGTHDRGLRNSRSVMTESRLAQVRERLKAGATNKTVATEFAVSATTISRIRSGRRYSPDLTTRAACGGMDDE